MRILILCSTARISGGAEKIALTSAIELANRGHEVRVIAAHGPAGDEFKQIPNLTIDVLDPEPRREGRDLLERAKSIWPEGVARSLKNLFENASESTGTVIHFHCGYLELGIPGFRSLAHSGLPIVYTHHDYTWACPLMGFYDYTKKQSCSLKGGSFSCLSTDCAERYLEKLVRFGRHFGTHQTSGIRHRVSQHLFVSETSRAKLLPYLPANASNQVLFNASEAEQKPRCSATDDSELIFLGRLTEEKDPMAFALATREAEMGAKIIGDGPLRGALEQSGFGAHLLGWKSQEEVNGILAGSRALVVTSRCLETASLVVLEAASLGVAAIVPSDTAAAEFVNHECTGLIYDRSQEGSLKESLLRVKNSGYANFLGAEAYRQYWNSPPTWDRHLDSLEGIYERVVEG